MSTESETPTWGDQPPPQAAPGPSWNGRKTVVAVAIAVGIAAAGGGVIYAASQSEAAQQGMGGPRGYGMRGGPLVVMGGPFGDTQHGEFQNGEVTEISDAAITVKSPDGYTATYRIDDDTQVNGGQGDLDDIAAGDIVTVVASESTADSILEGGKTDGGGKRQQDGQPPADGRGTPPTR